MSCSLVQVNNFIPVFFYILQILYYYISQVNIVYFNIYDFFSNLVILSKRESNIQNLSINYCPFDHRKLNLMEIKHDLFSAVMDLGLSE